LNREEWLKARLNGIGASEAAAIMGCSPYMSNYDLWQIKTGRKSIVDISDKPFVKYGIEAEPLVRDLFALDHPELRVTYKEFDVVQNLHYSWLFATLDGRILKDGKEGIYEGKTTEILRSGQWDEWNGRVPAGYYCQLLHQLLATGWDFAVLKARIRWRKNGELNITEREYWINREDVTLDLATLLNKEIEFWHYVTTNTRPPQALPEI